MFILFSCLLIFTNLILFWFFYERRLICTIKKGELLSGEIIKVYKYPTGRNIKTKKPKVSVVYKGEEHIFQGIAQITNYRQGQRFNVYYNKNDYPDYVLLDQKNTTIVGLLLYVFKIRMAALCVCGLSGIIFVVLLILLAIENYQDNVMNEIGIEENKKNGEY